jgi:succinate-acetate transporter protein
MEGAMQEKSPGAVSLGYAVLFIVFFLMFMPFAGWISFDSYSAVVPVMMILSITLAIAGIFTFFTEAKIESVLFLVLASIFFAFALRFVMYPELEANTSASGVDGWQLILTAIIVFYLWLSSMKGNNIRQILLLLLWLALLAGALANWIGMGALSYIAGYLGLLSGLLAGWYSASTVLPAKEAAQ